jgi:hypothetical protein
MAASLGVSRSIKAVERESPLRQDLSPEAEEEPVLESVARKRLVKTWQAGKSLAGAEVWR